MPFDPATFTYVVALSTISGLGAVAFLMLTVPGRVLIEDSRDRTIFLVEGSEVVDATQNGRMMIELLGDTGWTTEGLLRWLGDAFPELPSALAELPANRDRTYLGRDGISRLDVAPDGDRVRLTLCQDGGGQVSLDRICLDATRSELESLRRLGDALPFPTWRQDADGCVVWANRAYLDLVGEVTGTEASWPPANLAPQIEDPETPVRMRLGDGWFECRAHQTGGEVTLTATRIDGLVEAEHALSAFKNTMSRTFAHLTVGLAIFDKARRLAVFNPALTDLTTLPVTLLIAQPTLDTFLDALRSRQMMPEPRDYASWRDRVASVEAAAQSGTYSELWHLPGGRTFRITGRPQPDGAFALLMEDISAEISLTRSFRAEIATGHAVIDAIPDAIAVFDRTGTMTMTNAAYDRLWGTRTQDGMDHLTLAEAISFWRTGCELGAFDTILDQHMTVRQPHEIDLWLDDGRRAALTMSPLPGGATMIRFALKAAEVSKLMPSVAHDLIEARLKA